MRDKETMLGFKLIVGVAVVLLALAASGCTVFTVAAIYGDMQKRDLQERIMQKNRSGWFIVSIAYDGYPDAGPFQTYEKCTSERMKTRGDAASCVRRPSSSGSRTAQ